ncbi:mRNA 3'-end-processing protein yth-1 [Coniochaeta hoffmannii]|uniref:mRNA 3'-end-processing protein n=1 Tax=Coniochaeta hoffmannii TaxID=91930 RepID=A0AA38VB50_9PEZI|nr:mRNA 3'-end-processing protein yth-1 [Coniochaeta hoffmannii]
MASTASQSHALASQLLTADHPPRYTFTFTPFLQRTHQHSLPADRPICRSFATTGQCPLKTRCPERHVGGPAQAATTSSSGAPPFGTLVCKHWLRGLCKKGDGCEFLHEYNLRRMPECNFFLRNGYCSNGDECLYLHIDPESRLPPCPWYERGFCPLGPRCGKKHVHKKNICPYYLCGFCPEGRRECKEGAHPKWVQDKDLEKPRARVERTREEEEEARRVKEEEMRERQREREEREGYRDGGRGGFRDRGGRGGWRGKRGGGGGFRGRGH